MSVPSQFYHHTSPTADEHGCKQSNDNAVRNSIPKIDSKEKSYD